MHQCGTVEKAEAWESDKGFQIPAYLGNNHQQQSGQQFHWTTIPLSVKWGGLLKGVKSIYQKQPAQHNSS